MIKAENEDERIWEIMQLQRHGIDTRKILHFDVLKAISDADNTLADAKNVKRLWGRNIINLRDDMVRIMKDMLKTRKELEELYQKCERLHGISDSDNLMKYHAKLAQEINLWVLLGYFTNRQVYDLERDEKDD